MNPLFYSSLTQFVLRANLANNVHQRCLYRPLPAYFQFEVVCHYYMELEHAHIAHDPEA